MVASLILIALLAQPAAPAANSKAKAKALLSEGTALYEKGELTSALEKFTQAYAEYDSPKLLFNIAQTSRALGRLAEAVDAFERFLAAPPDDAPEMTAEARSAVAELRAKMGRLKISCAAAGAEISVDGELVGVSPLSRILWVTPGQHQVTARGAATIPVVQNVEIAVGTVLDVVLQLYPLAASPPGDAQTARTREPFAAHNPRPARELQPKANASSSRSLSVSEQRQASEPSEGWWLGRRWTWVAAGSTVALLTSAAIVGKSMQSLYDSKNRSCGSESPDYPGCSASDISAVTHRRDAANILWALSGAAAVTTGILFFVEGHSVHVAPTAAGSPGLTALVRY